MKLSLNVLRGYILWERENEREKELRYELVGCVVALSICNIKLLGTQMDEQARERLRAMTRLKKCESFTRISWNYATIIGIMLFLGQLALRWSFKRPTRVDE